MPVEKRHPIPVMEAIERVVKQNILMSATKVNIYESEGFYFSRKILLPLMQFHALINRPMMDLHCASEDTQGASHDPSHCI
ncbi:molybdopterin biosynthesis protein [Staphylococcus aureus]|nr:molybdopterin biosynthesis protein [Staphylococcus aureus]